jgi:hypothetical protein
MCDFQPWFIRRLLILFSNGYGWNKWLLRRSYKEFPVEAEEIFSIKSEVLFLEPLRVETGRSSFGYKI